MDFTCQICLDILKNPIECNKCHVNFCKEHINTFYSCPYCNVSPFSGNINLGITKLLNKFENDRINEEIKKDENKIKCTICSFESEPIFFCFHLVEEHKKELIEKFGRKKFEQNKREESKLIQKEIKYETNKDGDNNFSEILNNQSEIISKKNYSQINSGEINNKIEIDKDIKPQNQLSRSQVKPYYCQKKHETINCACCPDRICRQGNCFCTKCMYYNIKRSHLKGGALYNKAGRIAIPENGEYHCNKKIGLSFRNSVGQTFRSQKQCSYLSQYFCKECKILNKNKDKYLDYISNAK